MSVEGAEGASPRLIGGVALAGLLVAAGATIAAPLWLLLLAPLLFGIPHVLGDLWVLFLRPGAPRDLLAWLAPGLVGMTALRAAGALGVSAGAFWEHVCGVGVLLAGVLWARGGARSWVWGLGAAAVAVPALIWPSAMALGFGHAHNLVAVGILVALLPLRQSLPVALVFAAGMVAILLGGLEGHVSWEPAAGLGLAGMARTLAPGVAEPWASRLVASFAFGQAIHYLCWVGLLPGALGRGPTEGRDLRGLLVAVGIVGTLLLVLAARVDPLPVRAGYLGLVLFHGWMELGVLAAGAVRR